MQHAASVAIPGEPLPMVKVENEAGISLFSIFADRGHSGFSRGIRCSADTARNLCQTMVIGVLSCS